MNYLAMVKNVLLIIKTVGVIVYAIKKIARSKKNIGIVHCLSAISL